MKVYYISLISVKKKEFDDLIIYLVIGIILGGRLGYVIFYNTEYYSQNFFEIFKLLCKQYTLIIDAEILGGVLAEI